LANQTLIKNFLEDLSQKNLEDWPETLGANLVNNNWFFLRYAIQIAFISNGIQLLDIPHQTVKTCKYFCHRQSQKKEIKKEKFVDDFAYDLGYYQS